jgi:hypothetical protein
MENVMKKSITLAAIAIAAAASGNVLAHGDTPKHGGIVQAASDLSFELVKRDGKATIYVEDHGKPVSTAGATGKLTVLNGAEKSEVPLEPAGENTLATKGEVKLGKGVKAIAALTFADKNAVNVRFSMK